MIESIKFRDVLGAYPTGVCVITSIDADGRRFGLVVGSFTSISLDPPLIGFFPDKRSTSWPRVAATGKFCVNILGSRQLDLCKRFAARGDDKFNGLDHEVSPAGLPVLNGTLAWIDCRIHHVSDVGDHLLVVGAIDALGKRGSDTPLIFFRGQYHDIVCLTN
jgi:flavin reductase (DIM6/NTAB) family NADH-FMN oxidoreductase RutF